MNTNKAITLETTAYHFPEEGDAVSAEIKVQMNVLDNQIFYHVKQIKLEKRTRYPEILIERNTGWNSSNSNYTFRYEGKDFYLKIDI